MMIRFLPRTYDSIECYALNVGWDYYSSVCDALVSVGLVRFGYFDFGLLRAVR